MAVSKSKRLTEVRNLLQSVQLELEHRGPTSTPKIIAAMRAKYSAVLRGAADDLEEVALSTLLYQVSRRTRSVKSDLQGDFFREYPGIPVSITIPGTQDAKGRRRQQLFLKSTRADIAVWLSDDAPRRLKKRSRHPGVTEFLKEIEPYISSDTCTIEDALKARETERKKAS